MMRTGIVFLRKSSVPLNTHAVPAVQSEPEMLSASKNAFGVAVTVQSCVCGANENVSLTVPVAPVVVCTAFVKVKASSPERVYVSVLELPGASPEHAHVPSKPAIPVGGGAAAESDGGGTAAARDVVPSITPRHNAQHKRMSA